MFDRRSCQCHKTDCDSEARWRLHIYLQCGSNRNRHCIQAPSTILVCNNKKHHRAAVEYMLSDVNKSNITAELLANGFPAPDWSSSVAAFEPIDPAALVMQ